MNRKGVEIKGLVSNYYEVGPESIQPGMLVWIPSLYPNKDNLVVDLTYLSDPSEQDITAPITPLSRQGTHLPVKSLGLSSDEFLFAVKGKIRLAVVLSGGFSHWATNPTERLWTCVPLYTVDKPRIPQNFVVEVQALKYQAMFYLPPETRFHVEESIARFNLIQVVHGYPMSILKSGNDNVSLTDEFFGWLKAKLTLYFGGALSEERANDLNAYGEIILEEAKMKGLAI